MAAKKNTNTQNKKENTKRENKNDTKTPRPLLNPGSARASYPNAALKMGVGGMTFNTPPPL
jgi:hypothetical protein